ncbi:ABC transporter ATP-binding protein [Gilvimarinus algae]|uniref:ABC transporter ATP-binding protein n=1 Tax=Gilvimarinus algae TaxID=3058037 RepID=A0ABT8TEG5_9GAMM|nr:ABC transporter ATP-binding protein [Gilvimarinus sp. SDUM040014]MDO3382326.1 ABC transporter ATP-binding protein [Gilvimarinus sp. SDUM040014]
MSEPVLRITDLSLAFHQEQTLIPVVKSLNLEIQPGEVLALVGESGSGKSVTAQSILKLLPASAAVYQSGSIVYGGDDLLGCNEKSLARIRGNRISMIFQEPMTSLNPLHTIEKQLAEVLFLHKGLSPVKARKPVLEWLERVGIRDPQKRLSSLPHELSGGERQRVMIAMALINEPDLLIADEPTTALDVTVQSQILQLLKQLQRDLNMAVLFITHDLKIVKRLADRVAIMRAGQILEVGQTSEVFSSPTHEYTRLLLASDPGEAPSPVKPDAEPLLEVKRLRTWFPVKRGVFKKVVDHIKAADDINFTLRVGETLGIVGESGSGKTTVGRSILRLIASEGQAVYYGSSPKDLFGLSAKALKPLRRELQIIFQDPYGSLSPRMSIAEIIAEGLEVHETISAEEKEHRVIQALTRVRLDPAVRHRYPNEFSGGQRQRVAIARALILKPRLLVLDEPTSALDRSVQKEVVDLLKQLQQDYAMAYVFISHDLDVVRAMSHKIIVMRRGQIVESGTAEQLFREPEHEYTRTLLQSASAPL